MRANFLASLDGAARATCHVLLIDPKSAPSSFRRIGESNGASPVTIGPAVLALFTKVLGHTNFISQMPQPNSFQSTLSNPLRIDSNDKSLCRGISAFITRGRHCLIALPWAKIVDIAMFKFNSALSFTRKAPLKDARARVHDAPHHPVSFTVQ